MAKRKIVEEIMGDIADEFIEFPEDAQLYGKRGGHGGGREPTERTKKRNEAVEKFKPIFERWLSNLENYGVAVLTPNINKIKQYGFSVEKVGEKRQRDILTVKYGGFEYSINELWKRFLKENNIEPSRHTAIRVNTVYIYKDGKKVPLYVIYAMRWFDEKCKELGISKATADAKIKELIKKEFYR